MGNSNKKKKDVRYIPSIEHLVGMIKSGEIEIFQFEANDGETRFNDHINMIDFHEAVHNILLELYHIHYNLPTIKWCKNLLRTEIKKYPNAKQVVWCQEEPKNQGPWFSSRHKLESCLQKGQTLSFVGRAASAAPSVGYVKLHRMQQNTLVEDALQLNN